MKVFQVRHGSYSLKPGGLNAVGLYEARQAARFIAEAAAGKKVKVICSPQLRAKQTAEQIATVCGLKPQVLRWLDEREFSYPVFEHCVEYEERFNGTGVLVVVHHEANIKLVATLRTQARFEQDVLPGTVVELDWSARTTQLAFSTSQPTV